jgi:hypothetical protein
MTRTENDLRDALRELEQRADQQGAPSTAGVLAHTSEDRLGRPRDPATPRLPRWLPPLAAAALVAAAAVTAVTLSAGPSGSSHRRASPVGGRPTGLPTAARHTTAPSHHPSAGPNAASAATATAILDDAAATLDAAPTWTTPAAQDFFYVRTTEATTWTSVSGARAGAGQTADGGTIWVPGCKHGHIVSSGQSGTCTLNDVPHYLADAPTAPPAWDAYLEQIAPGAKAANAQGKIIVEVLHQDLTAPRAAAALLRYTARCPGLHTLAVRPVAGQKLIGVGCTSMTNGSYSLAFDATSHALVGFIGVAGAGQQNGPAEIIRRTGLVEAIGRTP